ncbi:MAG: glycosyltransferase family 4 protein [Vicinamibacterales bacterium]
MRIAIEALGIDRPGGGRVATLNLLRPLLARHDEHSYSIWLSAPEPSLEGLHPRAHQHVVSSANRFVARLVLQRSLPRFCRQEQIDLVHFVKNQVVSGTGTRAIATVYDLTTLRHPEAYPAIDVLYWRHVLPRQYRRLDGLIAISRSTGDDLASFYSLPSERIRVIPCGYDPVYRPADQSEIADGRRKHGLQDLPYFIHVGNLSRKKNLAMLLEAFLDFRTKTNFPGRLVLVGAEYSKGRDGRFFEILGREDARASVVLTGHVPQDDLIGLYGGALAFLFPSLHEGFGLVVLEAMACGAPVIAHATGAVSEVLGDAGIALSSPDDVGAWSAALARVASDDGLRTALSRAGLERASLFDPGRSADRTVAFYEDVVAGRTGTR